MLTMPSTTTPYRSILVSAVILPAFILVNICIFFKIYRKFRNDFRPVHIFIMNYFGTQTLQLFSYQLSQVFVILSTQENCNENFFSLFASLTWYLGIIAMHTDRFVAIFWDIHYEERVTTTRALTLCVLNLVTAGSLASLAKIIDNEYSACTSPEIIVYTRITNILLEGLTKLLVAAVMVVVSTYVVIKKKLVINNVVHILPTTSTVSTVGIEAAKERRTQIRRRDSQPNMFYRVESGLVQMTRENQIDQTNKVRKLAWAPRRLDASFNNVPRLAGSSTTTAEQPITVLNETEFYLMVKNTTTMTVLTILQLFTFLPYVILGMVYNNCSMDSGHCDNFILLYRMYNPTRVLFFIVQSVVVIKRLMCSN